MGRTQKSVMPAVTTDLELQLRVACADLEGRLRAGERVHAEEYFQAQPELLAQAEAALDLIFAEYLLRADRENPQQLKGEFYQRFPQWREELERQFQVLGLWTDEFSPAGPDGGAAEDKDSPAWAAVGLDGAAVDGAALASAALDSCGRFEILSEIGRGTMGVVFKAWQPNLNRVVALKMILGGGRPNPERIDRFHQEAEALSRLQHANIVQIHDAGYWRGCPYLALELVEGGSLGQRLQAGPQPIRATAELVATLARAVHHAHEQGVVHRDLRPGNIFLTAQGVPKIGDFGLAKLTLPSKGFLTLPGAVLGTPRYMAPEQANGQEVGPPADIYALGGILYEMLTGRSPFMGETILDTLYQVQTEEPLPPHCLRPKVPLDLETICLKCLDKEPPRRYATARDLADDLERFLQGEPVRARKSTFLGRGWRWCCRNQLLASLLGVTAALAMMTWLASIWLYHERGRAVQAEQDASDKLRNSYLDQARAGRLSDQAGQRFASLEALVKAAAIRPGPDLRNEVLACLALDDLRVAQTWPVGEDGLALDPLFEHYARWDKSGKLSLRRLADHQVLRTFAGPGKAAWVPWVVQFSPRGTYLAAKFHEAGHNDVNLVWVWKVASGDKVLAAEALAHAAVDFSPDERCLALGHLDRSLRFYDLPSGNERGRFPLEATPFQVRFHPRGDRLAISDLAGNALRIYDRASGKEISKWLPGCGLRGIAWHPQGKLLAAAGADLRVHLWDLRAGDPQAGNPQPGPSQPPYAALEGHGWTVTEVAFSRNGDLLASTGWDQTLMLWDPWRKRPVLSVPGWNAPGFPTLQFGPHDNRLGCSVAAGKAHLWEVVFGRECRSLAGESTPEKRLWGASLSPEGRFLALAHSEGVRLLAAATGQEVAFLPIGLTRSAFFHPSEAALYTWGNRGLARWPITSAATGGRQIGPPDSLGIAVSSEVEWAALSDDGRILAAGDRGKGQVVVVDVPRRKLLFRAPHANPCAIAVSPKGTWVAGATWNDPQGRIRIWEVATGKMVGQLPDCSGFLPAFSSDEQWLLAGWIMVGKPGVYRVWRTGTWEQAPNLPNAGRGWGHGALAFCPQGNFLAVSPHPGLLQLLEVGSWKELAAFPAGEPMAFSRDGSHLITKWNKTLRVWDLRAIRQHLRELNLDWDLPPYAATERRLTLPQPPAQPWKVDCGDGGARFQRAWQAK